VAAALLMRCADWELVQKSGAAICLSNSSSWVSFLAKSKTLQELVDGFLRGS
jgi:hypothetical protein